MSRIQKKPAAIPLFGDAYLADTTHLTTEQHGAYLLLLIAAWRQPNCDLPNDDKKLARIAGLSPQKWRSSKETILEFWTVDGDRIFQKRQVREREWVSQKSDTNRKNSVEGWKRRKALASDQQDTENKQKAPSERKARRKRNPSETDAPPPPPHNTLLPKGNNGADAPPIDIVRTLFDFGVHLLQSTGKLKAAHARSLIGKWRKEYSDGIVLAVMSRAQEIKPSQPVEWITKALQDERRRAKGDDHGNEQSASHGTTISAAQQAIEEMERGIGPGGEGYAASIAERIDRDPDS